MELSKEQIYYIQNEVEATNCGYEVDIQVPNYGTFTAFQCCDGYSRGGSKIYHIFANKEHSKPVLIETMLLEYQPILGRMIKLLFDNGCMQEGAFINLTQRDDEDEKLIDDFSIFGKDLEALLNQN